MNEKMYKASDVIGILLEEITPAEFLKVAKRLSDIPSAVVRCKDCKHSDIITSEPTEMPLKCLGVRYGGVYPDWFCEHGERRSE